jgi:hypothetical protein
MQVPIFPEHTGFTLEMGNQIITTLAKAVNSHDIEDFKTIFHSYLSPTLEVTSQLFGKIDPLTGRPQNIYASQTGQEMKTKLTSLQEFYDFYERSNVVIPDGYLRSSHILHSHFTKNEHIVLQCKFLYRGTFLTYPNGKDVGHSFIDDETFSAYTCQQTSSTDSADMLSYPIGTRFASVPIVSDSLPASFQEALRPQLPVPTISMSSSLISLPHSNTSTEEEELAKCLLIMTSTAHSTSNGTNSTKPSSKRQKMEPTSIEDSNMSMIVIGNDEMPTATVKTSSTISDIGIIGEKSFKAIGSYSIHIDVTTHLIDKIEIFYEHHF